MIVSKWIARAAMAVVVPFLTQGIWILGLGTLWVSAWNWMNALPTWWAMAIIIGPSLAGGIVLLFWAFGWYAAPLAVVYVPAMFVALANWTGRLALRL